MDLSTTKDGKLQEADTKAETATIHLRDVINVKNQIEERIQAYKGEVEDLRNALAEAENDIKNSQDQLIAELGPSIDKSKKSLHVKIVTQREENDKLQQQIIQLKKEKAELVQHIINLKKKTDELQKDLGRYPGKPYADGM